MLKSIKHSFFLLHFFLLVLLLVPHAVFAHGSMLDPISRVYACYLQGPETPDCLACKEVIDAGGTQPLYDWNEVNQLLANGDHQVVIPDGQLVSAGREKPFAFDEPRPDWPTTILPDKRN